MGAYGYDGSKERNTAGSGMFSLDAQISSAAEQGRLLPLLAAEEGTTLFLREGAQSRMSEGKYVSPRL